MKAVGYERRNHGRPVIASRAEAVDQQQRYSLRAGRRRLEVMHAAVADLNVFAVHTGTPQIETERLVRHLKRKEVNNRCRGRA